jgi:hypothetical protein
MTKPIRISGVDRTEEEVRARHKDIEDRLTDMGMARVRLLAENGGFPTEWGPILIAWLANDKLEK